MKSLEFGCKEIRSLNQLDFVAADLYSFGIFKGLRIPAIAEP
jgi:hypothetical protein